MANPLIKLFRSKIYTALIMLIVIMFIGVLGYRFISGYSWVNAVYMTVITITTVGFAEVNPLDTPSKIFTIFLIKSLNIFINPKKSLLLKCNHETFFLVAFHKPICFFLNRHFMWRFFCP